MIFHKILLVFALSFLVSCGINQPLNEPHEDLPLTLQDLQFGTDQTLEIMTWNIEHFPKADSSTVNYAAQIIKNLDVDIVCLQEIQSDDWFTTLDELLDDWTGFKANSSANDFDLAFLYKNTPQFEFIHIQEIFTDLWWELPRAPLILTISWNQQNYYIINNHLKALGGSENESRRKAASDSLNSYITQNLPNENVIIAGDLNDRISDSPQTNVFNVFLEQPQNYTFTDYSIAYGPSEFWSWGNGSTHLDHIIISNELFDEFQHPDATTKTIRVDDYLENGWTQYDNYISDHRPVALRLGE